MFLSHTRRGTAARVRSSRARTSASDGSFMPSTRLTALDASFLEVETSTAHMHVGWAATFATPRDGRAPRFEELRDHVESRLGRAPPYPQKPAEVPLGMSDPVWIDDPDFDVQRHVRHARSSDFHEVVDEVMSRQLDRDCPLWELWIADRLHDGRIGVVGKVHHCMVDGIAAVELASVLLDPSPEPPAQELEQWRPSAPPDALRLLVEGTLDRVGRAASVARLPLALATHPDRVLDLLASARRAVRAARHSLLPAPPSILNDPISDGRHLATAQRPF